jgi:hypothetical protein
MSQNSIPPNIMTLTASVVASYIFYLLLENVHGFMPQTSASFIGVRNNRHFLMSADTSIDETPAPREHDTPVAIRAPLKYVGSYPVLALRFPHLATSSQRERNVTGVSLDFILDTAANINTINSQVATELQLNVVGRALPGVATTGAIDGADTYLLGDCALEGLQDDEPFVFMSNLTASSLMVRNSFSAGLLSLAFFNCFPGGVEFSWGIIGESGKNSELPSVTFFGDKVDAVLKDRGVAKITPLDVTQLPSVTVKVNGVKIQALLDTGSPITVLNAEGAKAAGIKTAGVHQVAGNPFARIASGFQMARAATRGEILTVASNNGPITLLKSDSQAELTVVGSDGDISFGSSNIYVGELPGLAALNGLGINSRPALVLGMDILRKRPKMLLRAQQSEVYF